MTTSSNLCPLAKRGRLQQLGITEDHFDRYCKMFCVTRRQDRYLNRNQDSWPTVKHPWDAKLLFRHLGGEITIGLFPAASINYLMFDIDNHEPGLMVSPQERCRLILSVYSTKPLVYTSSESGGLRVCYFLDQVHPRRQVYQFAERRLASIAIEVKSGYIEIRATGAGDRLPFGKGSELVDPKSLLPVSGVSLAEKIDKAWEIRLSNKLKIDHSTAKPENNGLLKPKFVDIVGSLLEDGLPTGDVMTTNEALMKLNWDLMGRRGYTAEEAKRFLGSWISNHHNGHSDDINAGRIEDVYAHIDRIVGRFDPHRIKFTRLTSASPENRLTLHDVEVILLIFDSYQNQLAVFSLLEYTKAHGELMETAENIAGENSAISYSMSNYNVVGFLQVWLCRIPYKTFLKLPGFDRTRPSITRKLMESKGIMLLHEQEDRSNNRCRAYKICFPFNSDSPRVISLDEALLQLKDKTQLRIDYGPYRSGEIRKKE